MFSIIREMEIIATMRYHFVLTKIKKMDNKSIEEDVQNHRIGEIEALIYC